MQTARRILFACLFVAFVSFPIYSQIYKWKDNEGNLVVSTSPPPPGVKSEKQNVSQSTDSRSEDARKGSVQDINLARDNRDIKVLMYMTDWCPHCKKAAKFLDSLGVNWTQYDIEKDPEKREEYLAKGKGETGVPLIDIEGILLRGFSEDGIKQALNKRKNDSARY
jgi:glutaredoxin